MVNIMEFTSHLRVAFTHDSNGDTPIPGMMVPFSLELNTQLYTAQG